MAEASSDAPSATNTPAAGKMHEMAMKDDLARDKMAHDLYVDAAKTIGQYGSSVDIARIKAEQDKERMHNEAMMRVAGI